MNGSRLFAHLMYVGVPVLAAGQKTGQDARVASALIAEVHVYQI